MSERISGFGAVFLVFLLLAVGQSYTVAQTSCSGGYVGQSQYQPVRSSSYYSPQYTQPSYSVARIYQSQSYSAPRTGYQNGAYYQTKPVQSWSAPQQVTPRQAAPAPVYSMPQAQSFVQYAPASPPISSSIATGFSPICIGGS